MSTVNYLKKIIFFQLLVIKTLDTELNPGGSGSAIRKKCWILVGIKSLDTKPWLIVQNVYFTSNIYLFLVT
jgi:hypothetical protein